MISSGKTEETFDNRKDDCLYSSAGVSARPDPVGGRWFKSNYKHHCGGLLMVGYWAHNPETTFKSSDRTHHLSA